MNNTIKPNPTVYIIDDDPNMLFALQALLDSVELHSECFTCPMNFLNDYNPDQYGCILTDVRMPVMGGIQLLEQLKSRKNRIPVIVLTGYADVPMVIDAMKIGAIDFVPKPFNNQHLLDKIQQSIANSFEQYCKDTSHNYTQRYATLTKREQQVMHLISSGKLNKQIAQELFISNSTVEFHRSKVMKKMGAKNLADLIKIYLALQ